MKELPRNQINPIRAKMPYIERIQDQQEIDERIKSFKVTAILGPRQCGKTTLARSVQFDHYFDLENPRDEARLENPQLALEDLTGLIVIDEIQRHPELFPLMRFLVDRNNKQKYLILGSASRDLIRQSSDSLAGRIAYYSLGGFSLRDIGTVNYKKLWFRGGFPDAYLAESEEICSLWKDNYIKTFLERDIPQLGINIPSRTLRRFWTMLSHYHGQIINYSEIARSFGISDMTVRKYVEILEGTFMLRVLQPWYENVGKRLVKRPKVYLRDSGLFHALTSIESFDQLAANPKLGASWEGFAMDCTIRQLGIPEEKCFFWSVHSGSELDLFWQQNSKNWGVEFKYADAPKLTKSLSITQKDLNLSHIWIIYPGKETYQTEKNMTVLPLSRLTEIKNHIFS